MIRLACTLEIPLASATSNWVQGIEKSGESRARGKLHPVWPRALRLGRPAADPTVACTALLEAIAQRVKDFDVVHSHIDWLHLPLFSRFGVPFLTTMHGRLDLPGLSDVVRQFSAAPFVSISDIWLLIEWPAGEEAPTKYWLSTLPANIGFRQFVDIVKLRWRIERDYHELKQEVGLGYFEGRSWRGFHHHATLCIAAYGFLVSERETIPPQKQPPPSCSRKLQFQNRHCGLNGTFQIQLRPFGED